MGMTQSDENKLFALRDYIVKLANATSSFASRLNYEPDTGKSLKVIGDIELQKLGIVPQTVFLKVRNSDMTGTRRTGLLSVSSRRLSSARTPVLSPSSRFSRMSGGEYSSGSIGAPFEDLRRRLATINGSASSLSAHNTPRDTRNALSPIPNSSSVSAVPTPSLPDRPPSPSESTVSTTSVSLRPSSRLQVGSTDGQKAAPAVGSSKASAIGHLEAHYKIRSEGSTEESGRSSPMSMSQTLRFSRVARNPSFLAISTYGECGKSNVKSYFLN
jgi:phosphoinositide-3-kinase regulatory subunit 4